jgi:hypothetical protein
MQRPSNRGALTSAPSFLQWRARFTTTKEAPVPTATETDRTTKNGDAHGAAEGIAEGIAESFEGLATIARTQAEESFRQGEKAGLVLRDQTIASLKAIEAIGVSLISAFDEMAGPFTPKLPAVVPTRSLDALVKAGFDIAEQVLNTERTLADAAVRLVIRRTA